MAQLKQRLLQLLAAGLLLALVCSGCARQEASLLVGRGDPYDPYTDIALEALDAYQLHPGGRDRFSLMHGENILECFDVQAVPAVRQGVGNYWYPQCLATVVLAVDRSQTDAVIRGWRDLLSAGVVVNWSVEETIDRMNLAALAYGLEDENYTIDPAITLLQKLYQAGQLVKKDDQAPVQICFDFQAVQMIHQGRDLEIVVPQEGTFAYAMGMLSHRMLNTVSDESLLNGGMRLADGRCTDPAYPPEEAYEAAVQISDFDHFMQQTVSTSAVVRRKVWRSRLYSSANDFEHVTFAMISIVAALIWMSTAMHRSIRRDIQRAVRMIGMSIVGWLVLRLFKYQINDATILNRICWYGYYIFQLALPLIMLYIAAIFDQPESNGRPPRWYVPVRAAYPALLLMVFTNDLHQFVFRFDPGGTWSDEYTYGPGYFIIYAYCIAVFFASVGLLIFKSWKSPKRAGWIFPALLGMAILIYSTGYAMGIPLARDSDFTITICTFAILFFESALRTGLLPANTQYRTLFASSPLDMQLLDEKGKTVLAASSAAALEPVLRVQLQSQPSISVSRDADTLLFGHEIHGGTVVWQENIAPLNRLHREIKSSVVRMQAANALLRRDGEVRRQKMAADVKAELFASLERETEAKTKELTQAIRDLPAAPDRERQIAYITLLLCHIKRRCNLFFLTREGVEMGGEELSMYLDELSEFAGYAGTRALVRCDLSGMIEVRLATLCYDFYFAVCAWSVQGGRETILGQLQNKEDAISFSILSAEEAGALEFPAAFVQAVEAAGGEVSRRIMDETAGLYLTFPKGGAEHG